MIVELLLLVAGLALLVVGADKFVESGSRIARALGISDFVIGLTLIAVGTSLPELVSGMAAVFNGSSGLVVGNLVGSNIANIGLIVGVCAVVSVIRTHETMLKRDGYIMMFVSVVFAFFAIDGVVGRVEGLALLGVYLVYLLFLAEAKDVIEKKWHFKEFVGYMVRLGFVWTVLKRSKQGSRQVALSSGILKESAVAAFSLVALVFGAKLLVDSALYLSGVFGLSETFIGLALVAVGTSLPELAVSLSAVRKGFNEMLIGNIVGSNIANIALIFGVSALIMPVQVAVSSVYYLVPAMLVFSAMLLLFIRYEWRISSVQGVMLLAAYILFLLFMALKAV